MCSNISTETTRSNLPAGAKRFMSAVITVTLERPRLSARSSMNAFWLAELETAVTWLSG